jgi:hypothetical protein
MDNSANKKLILFFFGGIGFFILLCFAILAINVGQAMIEERAKSQIVSVPATSSKQPEDKSMYPIPYEVIDGTKIRDTYFSIRYSGLQPNTFWGDRAVDILFQSLPDSIFVSYQKGSSPPTSAVKTALSQVIVTTEGQSVRLDSQIKEIVLKIVGIISIFIGLFIVILLGLLLYGQLERHGKKILLYLVMAFIPLVVIIYFTSSYNYIYFDNATDRGYTVRIDEKDISIAPKTHLEASINCGQHTLTIFYDNGDRVIPNTVIEVVCSNLLVYNIEGGNTYTVEVGTYK